MNLINCPGCKKGIWIQGDEDSIECPLCGKRLRIQKKSIKKHNAQVSEIDVYKKLLLQERKKKDEHESDAIRNRVGERLWKLTVGILVTVSIAELFGNCKGF